jgi:hypothetical protein
MPRHHGSFDRARDLKNLLKRMNVNKENGKAAEIHRSKIATRHCYCHTSGDGDRQNSNRQKDMVRQGAREDKCFSIS